MNKTELIQEIVDKTEVKKADVGKILDAFIQIVTGKLAAKEQVSIIGFGTFSVTEHAARRRLRNRSTENG